MSETVTDVPTGRLFFHFPPNPNVGDSVVGDRGVTWHWDGVKWVGSGVSVAPPSGGGVPEAPNDGNIYGRQNQVWIRIDNLPIDGGTYP